MAAPNPLDAPSTSPHSPVNGRQSAIAPRDIAERHAGGNDADWPRSPVSIMLRRVGGKGDRPTVENRWWVDQGKDAAGRPVVRPQARFGHRFFRTGEGFEQTRAQRRLTDLNLKWLDEAPGPTGAWTVLHLHARDRFPASRLARARAALPVPPAGRGVLVDSGNALRAIATADASASRLVELRLGGDNSFDAWVHGEWVREVVFASFDDALRRAPALIREYLLTDRAAPLA